MWRHRVPAASALFVDLWGSKDGTRRSSDKIRAWQEAQQDREETRGPEFCEGLCSHLPLGEHNDHTRKVQVQGVGCVGGGSRHLVSSDREGACQQRQTEAPLRMLNSGDRLICISTQESRKVKLGLGICHSV